jgi:thiosulfate reductase cytochrome b subunit
VLSYATVVTTAPSSLKPISAAHAQVDPAPGTIRRHSGIVRATHWITFLAFIALAYSGTEILLSHPRFYWGEAGNVLTRPLFTLPVPSSRKTVPTRYSYVLPDQTGWSRALHIQAAWALVLAGFIYGVSSLWNGHFRKDLLPARADLTWPAVRDVAKKFGRASPDTAANHSYNILQRTTYLAVIFVLFPLMVWTGLAMSPAFTSAFPLSVVLLGGRQSARTIHFFVSWSLLLFLVVHVIMVATSGFWARMRSMITGRTTLRRERA